MSTVTIQPNRIEGFQRKPAEKIWSYDFTTLIFGDYMLKLEKKIHLGFTIQSKMNEPIPFHHSRIAPTPFKYLFSAENKTFIDLRNFLLVKTGPPIQRESTNETCLSRSNEKSPKNKVKNFKVTGVKIVKHMVDKRIFSIKKTLLLCSPSCGPVNNLNALSPWIRKFRCVRSTPSWPPRSRSSPRIKCRPLNAHLTLQSRRRFATRFNTPIPPPPSC